MPAKFRTCDLVKIAMNTYDVIVEILPKHLGSSYWRSYWLCAHEALGPILDCVPSMNLLILPFFTSWVAACGSVYAFLAS